MTLPKAIREETVVVDTGAELFVRSVGAGAPVYLVHGNFVSNRMWAPQFEALAEHYAVVAPDLRGFGRSPLLGGRVPGWEDMAALMRALGHDRIHVVGASLGAVVGIDFTLTYPDRVRSLTVIPGGMPGAPFAQWMADGFAAMDAAAAAGEYGRARDIAIGFPPMQSLELYPAARQEVIEMIDEHRWDESWEGVEPPALDPPAYPRLAEIAAPTLIVSGELDDASFMQMGVDLEREIPRAQGVVIPGAGHVVNMEAPGAFNAVLLDFLARTEAE
jgi:pimeloyl-ACP methyl ester carboxylesterase